MSDLTLHSNTESFIGDIKRLVEQGRNAAYGAVNAVMIETYWRIGQRGFAFVGRQQLIRTAAQDYFIDLVFYNIILKCYVLIDLKIGKIKHQDVGQMDMYVRMFDELRGKEGNNPTIGIVLCSETDEDIAKYSILNGNEQLFASKYKLYLPTEEELRREIEQQKELYRLQQEGMTTKKDTM